VPKRSHASLSSNTYRFFVPPESISGEQFVLDDPELGHQLGAVLRLGAGDRVLLLDGSGRQYVVVLERVERRGGVAGVVERAEDAPGEPQLRLTLYAALIRPERFEWLLQKGVELGVAAFVPLVCARTAAEAAAPKKLDRWRRIVREAAEQSRRAVLPALHEPLGFAEGCARAAAEGPALLLWEGEGAIGLRQALAATNGDSLGVLSGPEGGLTDEERREAEGRGIIAVTLGPRTLRAETAPIIAAAAVFYQHGELE
jgi:16S rRNA (uracil1498-N3)-methyltransferase